MYILYIQMPCGPTPPPCQGMGGWGDGWRGGWVMFQKKQNKISKSKTGWEQCVETQLWENIGKRKGKARIYLKRNC